MGLMPSISLGRAARSAAAKIAAGLGEARELSALRELGNEPEEMTAGGAALG